MLFKARQAWARPVLLRAGSSPTQKDHQRPRSAPAVDAGTINLAPGPRYLETEEADEADDEVLSGGTCRRQDGHQVVDTQSEE